MGAGEVRPLGELKPRLDLGGVGAVRRHVQVTIAGGEGLFERGGDARRAVEAILVVGRDELIAHGAAAEREPERQSSQTQARHGVISGQNWHSDGDSRPTSFE